MTGRRGRPKSKPPQGRMGEWGPDGEARQLSAHRLTRAIDGLTVKNTWLAKQVSGSEGKPVHETTVSRWKTGDLRPTHGQRRLIEDVLGLPARYLEGEGPEELDWVSLARGRHRRATAPPTAPPADSVMERGAPYRLDDPTVAAIRAVVGLVRQQMDVLETLLEAGRAPTGAAVTDLRDALRAAGEAQQRLLRQTHAPARPERAG